MKKRTTGKYIPFEKPLIWQKKIVYKSRNDKPIWLLVKNFINYRAKTGEKFTRAEMFKYIYPDPKVHNYMVSHNNTVDNYRLLLNKVTILKNTDKRGIYIKLRNIPNRLSTTRLRKIAEDKSWTSWFVPFDEKI